MHQVTILIVDDEPAVTGLLKAALQFELWETYSVSTAKKAIEFLDKSPPDIAVLDLGLPDMDGKEVLRHIAQTSPLPVLVLSARSSADEKIACLEIGADDYLTKPFNTKELVARLKKMLSRLHVEEKTFEDDYLEIDLELKRVTVNGQEVHLTLREYQLLEMLVLNIGKTMTNGKLLGNIWGPEYSSAGEYLHVHIGHLRSKIELDHNNPKYIVNVHGIGYRFEPIHPTTA